MRCMMGNEMVVPLMKRLVENSPLVVFSVWFIKSVINKIVHFILKLSQINV